MRFILHALGTLAGCWPAGSGGSDRTDDARPDIVWPGRDDGTSDDSAASDDDPSDTAADSGTPVVTRFVALGDAGTGEEKQHLVADAVATLCAERGCDFALYLGDNIYSDGVSSVTDTQFDEKFEAPYAALDFPFYAVLGNHDYGDNGGGWEPYRTDAQVEYTQYSSKWRMPDQFYVQELGEVSILGLDTNAIVWGRATDQEAWFPDARDGSRGRWRIATGHHPYVSNGPHGNAGVYDGSDGNGSPFADFVSSQVCGQVDVYFCGHDHSLQWLVSPCEGTEFIVSGAGAKTSGVGGENATWFESSQLGFMYVTLTGDTFDGTFYDVEGNKLFQRTFTRTRR
jgi:hypothetical protein